MQSRQDDQQVKLRCAFCNQNADMMCSICQQVYYCNEQHQNRHWPIHKKRCRNEIQKRKDLQELISSSKCNFFEQLSILNIAKSKELIRNLRLEEENYKLKSGKYDMELLLEIGSTTCAQIRLLIALQQYSSAQNILTNYLMENQDFLSNTSNIQNLQDVQNLDKTQKQMKIKMILGKLRLISTLANLMHQLIRNSVDMYEILISHIQKIYGVDSIQVSNIYFSAGHYFNFLNQRTRSIACFLKAASLRKDKGGIAFYNIGLLLVKQKKSEQAELYFTKALHLLIAEQNRQNNQYIPQIFENFALLNAKRSEMQEMVENFQKAYYFYKKYQNDQKKNQILQLFMEIKNHNKNLSPQLAQINFQKEFKQKKPKINLSVQHYKKFKNAEKKSLDKKTEIWLQEFQQINHNLKQVLEVSYPKKSIQILFRNKLQKNKEDQNQQEEIFLNSSKESINKNSKFKIDLQLMKNLNPIQVSYLNQLNRLFQGSQQILALIDIFENSNFYLYVDRNKLNYFYELNPHLINQKNYLSDTKSLSKDVNESETQASTPSNLKFYNIKYQIGQLLKKS